MDEGVAVMVMLFAAAGGKQGRYSISGLRFKGAIERSMM
jgi:hypothetical protein